jgi:signal transduction histidine kinase
MKHELLGAIGNQRYLDYANDINESGIHLLKIIGDILDLSKIESGKAELHEENVDVMKALGSCLTIVETRAQEAGVVFACDAAANVPALYADELKLKQIMINILSNAINFTPSGGTITTNVAHDSDSGFAIRISDTGIGMALEDIPKALAPFQQIDSAAKGRNRGTGLGLPLTKILVELHGGSLEIDSKLDYGTTVTVRFPAERIVENHSPGATI